MKQMYERPEKMYKRPCFYDERFLETMFSGKIIRFENKYS